MSTTEPRTAPRFISFEGTDGCGKTTQMRLLRERLEREGHEVVVSAEPGGTDIGRQIRAILLDSANQAMASRAELLLYFASRAQAAEEVIRPALARGAYVLSDRFTDSSLAYQGVGRRLGRDTVLAVHEIACPGLWPDLTVLLDIDLETSLQRAHKRDAASSGPNERRLEEEAASFHQRVREAYLQLANDEPGRVKLVDGRADAATVAERIWNLVKP
ncbi:MAG TPA: dTMP kinase [Bryobacteraceae bacterium]|nr:dTMP kinase [Bryobacteraceae bacterium]